MLLANLLGPEAMVIYGVIFILLILSKYGSASKKEENLLDQED